jgi:hypothetical protein
MGTLTKVCLMKLTVDNNISNAIIAMYMCLQGGHDRLEHGVTLCWCA